MVLKERVKKMNKKKKPDDNGIMKMFVSKSIFLFDSALPKSLVILIWFHFQLCVTSGFGGDAKQTQILDLLCRYIIVWFQKWLAIDHS